MAYSKVQLKDVEIPGESAIDDIVATEMVKISLIKVNILRTNLFFSDLTTLCIKNIANELHEWNNTLPAPLILINVVYNTQPMTSATRSSIFFVHLLHLGCTMLLYRHIISSHLRHQSEQNLLLRPQDEFLHYGQDALAAAAQSADILNLLLEEAGIFKRCWLVMSVTHTYLPYL